MKIYRIIKNDDPLWSSFSGVIFCGYENTYFGDVAINDLYPDTETLFFQEMTIFENEMIMRSTDKERYMTYWNQKKVGVIPYIPKEFVEILNMSIEQYKISKFKVYPPDKLDIVYEKTTICAAIELFKNENEFIHYAQNYILYKKGMSCTIDKVKKMKGINLNEKHERCDALRLQSEQKEYWIASVKDIKRIREVKDENMY